MDSTPRDYSTYLKRFGLTAFRPGQQQVVDAVYENRDCLCIMPTGGGKSLCYQLPAIAREGTVLVISPLIALMKDQVDSLTQNSISATCINSSLTPAEQSSRISRMADGEFDLVYIAPERMKSRRFISAIESTNVQLLAIDEAHCISQWGHDFRPDYAKLGALRQQIGAPQTIALTATATTNVRQDIHKVLELKEPRIFVSGFARENLSLSVSQPSSNSEKDQMLLEFIKANRGAGIVYSSTRKTCDHLSELLGKRLRRKVAVYHAGLEPRDRKRVQEDFSSGKIDVIVATNAFGMGIDKSNLRFVVHYNIPGSIEAYYQEAGRAGRDGKPANCELLYSYQDRFIQEFFIENSYPSQEIVKQVYEYLCSVKTDPIEITLQELQNELESSVGTEGIRVSENLLEKSGAIERLESQQNQASVRISSQLPTIIDMVPRDAKKRRHVLRLVEERVGSWKGERVYFAPKDLCEKAEMSWEAVQRALRELNKIDCFDYIPPFRGRAVHVVKRVPFSKLKIDFSELEARKRAEFKRLESVVSFAMSGSCRQLDILEYFGDEIRRPCGQCDNCKSGSPISSSAIEHTIDDNPGCLYSLQVVLSGIARTHGRYGKTMVAQMLCGSSNKKMQTTGLRKLSTYGLLKGLSQTQATSLIDCLINAKLVTQTEQTKFRPLIAITDRGSKMMRGFNLENSLAFVPDSLRKRMNLHFRGKSPHVAELETESVEAETIQENISEAVNSNPAELEEIDVDSHDDESEEFESVEFESVEFESEELESVEFEPQGTLPVQQRTDEPHAGPQSNVSAADSPVANLNVGEIRPSFFWTWKLFSLGFSSDEIRQIRGLSQLEMASHLDVARENDLQVSTAWLNDLSDSSQSAPGVIR